jgi:hypothetical protein
VTGKVASFFFKKKKFFSPTNLKPLHTDESQISDLHLLPLHTTFAHYYQGIERTTRKDHSGNDKEI